MGIRAYIIIVALLAAVVGGIYLFDDVSATLTTGATIQCGTVADPGTGSDARIADLSDALAGGTGQLGGAAKCADARSSQMTWTLILLIGGLVIGGGAALTRPRKTPDASTSTDTATA